MADFTGQRNGPDYTVDIPKAKKKLTLADLAQANSGVPSGDPVAEARAYLNRSPADPNALTTEENAQRNAFLMAPPDTRGTGERLARSGVKGLGALGGLAQLASLPVGFLAPPAGAALYAGGTAAKMPERLWEGIEDPSQAMEPVEGGLEALGLLGARGAGRMGSVAPGVEMAGSNVARMAGPSRYESAVGAIENPNFQEVNPRGYLDQLLERLNGSKTADRSVRNIGNLQQEAPGGLSDVAAGRVGPPGSNIDRTRTYGDLNERVKTGGVQFEPSNIDQTRTYGNARELMTNGGIQVDQSPALSALENLNESPLMRASNLARKQALAKSFRTNTPLAEGF